MGAGIIIARQSVAGWEVLALQATNQVSLANGGGLDIPKGRQDLGESNWQCAVRETYEETSIQITDEDIISGPFSMDWLTVWLAETSGQDPIFFPNPETGDFEHEGFSWIPFSEMEQYCYPYLRPYLEWAHNCIKGL